MIISENGAKLGQVRSTGAPLSVAEHKKGVEYHHEITSPLAGLDLDSNEGTLSKERFWDLRNFRIETPGEITVRTGIKEYPLDVTMVTVPPLPITGNAEIVAVCEYVVQAPNNRIEDAQRFGVIVWWVDELIHFNVFDKKNEVWLMPSGVGQIVTSYSGSTEPIVSVCQIGNSLIISVFDKAVFECYPNAPLPVGSASTWTIVTLGKDVCPLPAQWRFADKTQGDLLMYDSEPSDGRTDTNGRKVFTPRQDPITGLPRTISLPLNADYWISNNANGAFYSILKEKQWVFGKGDATQAPDGDPFSAATGNTSGQSSNHVRSRAWGYRFVMTETRTDSKGNTVIRYSKASPDIWVEDRVYKPATIGSIHGGKEVIIDLVNPTQVAAQDLGATPDGNGNYWMTPDHAGSGAWNGAWIVGPSTGAPEFQLGIGRDGGAGQNFFPTQSDFFNLQTKFRGYTTGTGDPYYFLATYLGWHTGNNGPGGANFQAMRPPYKIDAAASEIKGAPLTVFSWSDFFPAGGDANVTEIKIFRTGHFGPDDKADSDVDSLSEPHVYGYAGSIKKGASFTDDVKDNALDQGDRPEDYDGYEVGQFSGQVAREYMTKLVLGNTKTTYWVDGPGPEVCANYESVAGGGYINFAKDYFKPAADGLNIYNLHFSYVDEEGNESDLRDVSLNHDPLWGIASDAHPTGDNVSQIFLVPPRGMDPFITSIHIWSSFYNAGTRDYYDLGTIPVTQPLYTIDASTLANYISGAGTFTIVRPSKQIKDYYEASQVIYSEGNQPYNFPPLNVEREHPYSAIIGMDTVIGDLVIIMTDGLTWTTLEGGTVRVEENTRQVGGVSRFAVQKWNKALFFLSTNGLYLAEGDGVVPFPAQVQTEVRKYLDEYIPGQPRHANARRASIGVLGHRYEVHLHFPSSLDLWEQSHEQTGDPQWYLHALPQATFVYKFTTGEIRRHYMSGQFLGVENYQFDITPDFALVSGDGITGAAVVNPTLFRPERVLFASHVDGTLWANFRSSVDNRTLRTVNCDYGLADWQGWASAEKPYALELPTSTKQIRMIYLKAAIQAKLTLTHGIVNPTLAYDTVRGFIHPMARTWDIANPLPGRPAVLMSRGTSVAIESKGVAPVVRIRSEPDANGVHRGAIQAIDLDVALKHHHPR